MALIAALMTILLLGALAAGLALATSTEALIAAAFQSSRAALYAAEAAVERALVDLEMAADWSAVLDGTARSTFVDGPPGGVRAPPGGPVIDLTQVVARANSSPRPWAAVPAWQVYASGLLGDLAPAGALASPFYVVVLVDAGVDPGAVAVRGEAFGPRSVHKIVEAMVKRSEMGDLRRLSWREVR